MIIKQYNIQFSQVDSFDTHLSLIVDRSSVSKLTRCDEQAAFGISTWDIAYQRVSKCSTNILLPSSYKVGLNLRKQTESLSDDQSGIGCTYNDTLPFMYTVVLERLQYGLAVISILYF